MLWLHSTLAAKALLYEALECLVLRVGVLSVDYQVHALLVIYFV